MKTKPKKNENASVTVTYDSCPARVIRCNGYETIVVYRYRDMVIVMARDEDGHLTDEPQGMMMYDRLNAALLGEALVQLAEAEVEEE